VSVTFVAVTAASVEGANEFGAALFLHEGGLIFDQGRRDAMTELVGRPEFGGAWTIHFGERAVGYIVLTVCYSLEFHGRFGLLDEFYIEEGARGQGIGSKALAFIDEQCRARGLRAVRLEVGHTNVRARGLYERWGYRADERHLMTKRLH
jgi:ribosomal protein S18 acetylase RimI-like enzyme